MEVIVRHRRATRVQLRTLSRPQAVNYKLHRQQLPAPSPPAIQQLPHQELPTIGAFPNPYLRNPPLSNGNGWGKTRKWFASFWRLKQIDYFKRTRH